MPDHKPDQTDVTQLKKKSEKLPYRPCAGIMLINRDGLVWIGRRLPKWRDDRAAHIWQMPQGGIDKGENSAAAAIRELREETGVTNARIVAICDKWLRYDLPDDLVGVALKGKYRGQKQRWYAMQFTGDDDEINIDAPHGEKAEFDQWRWESAHRLPELIVPFKRSIYTRVVDEFSNLLS